MRSSSSFSASAGLRPRRRRERLFELRRTDDLENPCQVAPRQRAVAVVECRPVLLREHGNLQRLARDHLEREDQFGSRCCRPLTMPGMSSMPSPSAISESKNPSSYGATAISLKLT